KLRAIRTQQGLSLHGVEEKSQGRWKAVVVGSYERGDRAVTVQRLAELADFYGVPVQELLPGTTPGGAAEPPPKPVLDRERLPASRGRSCSWAWGGWRRCRPSRAARRSGTRRRSRPSAATTTARCSRSARTTCAPSPSSTTSRPRSSPSS